MDFPTVGTVADHAYWLSGMKLRASSGNAPLGRINARSEAFGRGDPTPSATQTGTGTLTGGNTGPMPFTEQRKTWGPEPATAAHDVLHLNAQNLRRVVVHAARARLTCNPQLDVTTDGPLTLVLGGCGRTINF
jgi:hypothetical protein